MTTLPKEGSDALNQTIDIYFENASTYCQTARLKEVSYFSIKAKVIAFSIKNNTYFVSFFDPKDFQQSNESKKLETFFRECNISISDIKDPNNAGSYMYDSDIDNHKQFKGCWVSNFVLSTCSFVHEDVVNRSASKDCRCVRCKDFAPYGEPNQPDGTFKCHLCRTNPFRL